MVTLVRQRTNHDCAICCMTMLTGRTYEDVLAAVGDTFDAERGMRNEAEALKRLGFNSRHENGEAVGDFAALYRQSAVSPEYFRSMAWGRLALMTVPSLNTAGGWHMVLVDQERVYDPSSRRTYAAWAELMPQEMVLFRTCRLRAQGQAHQP